MSRSSLLAVLILGACALFEPVWSQAFSPPVSGVLPPGYWGILATDVDGSGLPDLLGYGFNGADYFPDPGGGEPGTFALGTPVPFYRPSIFPTPVTTSIVEHLDVDGDGDLDLTFAYTLFGSPTSWFWYPGMPGGSLGAPVPLSTTTIGPGPMAIGDLDGAGQWDLVIVSPVLGTNQPAMVEFWLNRPGSWVLALSEPASHSVPRIGDYDQDGDADTVFAGPPSTMYAPRLVSGDPSGTLGPSTSLAAPAGIWGSLGIADLDADGYPDIVATNCLNAPPVYPLSGLWTLRGDPNAVLVPGPLALCAFRQSRWTERGCHVQGDGEELVNRPWHRTSLVSSPGHNELRLH